MKIGDLKRKEPQIEGNVKNRALTKLPLARFGLNFERSVRNVFHHFKQIPKTMRYAKLSEDNKIKAVEGLY